jgi:glucose/arabinose dehydrogenase
MAFRVTLGSAKSSESRKIKSAAGTRGILTLLLTVALGTSPCLAAPASPTAPAIALQVLVSGLTKPLDFQFPRDGSGRLLVVEQGGTIRIVQNGALLPGSFLDISSLVQLGGETGLLGLAFHPSYGQNGRFFVNYTRNVQGQLQTVIAEFHVSASDPNKADPTGTDVLVADQPFDFHKGGQLAFGADRFLYITLGDGGSSDNGQKLNTLLGKVLRIDIDSGSPYVIPPDNPFVSNPSARGEIWAYGFRNPWRFSFDRRTGHLLVGDVGQNTWEEVDIIRKGNNYGWNIMEGRHCFSPPTNCDMTGLSLPIAEYSHSEGIAIIGGYIYHGAGIPGLDGVYIFGDLTGQIWGLRRGPTKWNRVPLLSSGKTISGFGQDSTGEMYVLDYGSGTAYRIVPG